MMDPNPTSPLQQLAIAINFFFPSLALLVLGLRIYGKVWSKCPGPGTFRHPSTLWGPDDALACLSMAFSIGLTIASYYFIKTNHVGIRVSDMPPPTDMKALFMSTYIVQLLYFPVLALIKSSVLFFLLRLGGQKSSTRLAIHGLNVLNLSMMVGVFIAALLQCRPVAYYCDPTIPGGHCINQPVFYLTQAGLNILTDLFTLAMPFWIFLGERMTRRLKIATIYVFFLGFIVTLVGITRFIFMYMLFYTSFPLRDNFSMSFSVSAIETNLAIICACAPTLRGLVRSWFPQALITSAGEFDTTEDISSEMRSASRGVVRNSILQSNRYSVRFSSRRSFSGDGLFGYGKDGRGRVICSTHSHTEGLGFSPSEEEMMTYDGILRTTSVAVRHAGGSSAGGSRLGTGTISVERSSGGSV